MGNRQLNAALHRIALTQARCHPDARALLARRRARGDGGLEALRVLKRHLSDIVYRALLNSLARYVLVIFSMAPVSYPQQIGHAPLPADQVGAFRGDYVRFYDPVRKHHHLDLADHWHEHGRPLRTDTRDQPVGGQRVCTRWCRKGVATVAVGAPPPAVQRLDRWGQRITDDATVINRFTGCQPHGPLDNPNSVR
nr:hypothetical protein [Kibdelosporangium phytohabitans]